MDPLKPFNVPSLGSRIRTRRQSLGLSVKHMALRLGLPIDRMRVLENDAGLPTSHEFTLLAAGLSELTPHLRRAVQVSALAQLAEALDASILESEAIAARPVLEGPEDVSESIWLLPDPLRIAVCDALGVSRTDRTAIETAWAALMAEPADTQRIASEAAVVQIVLEGDLERGPLLP